MKLLKVSLTTTDLTVERALEVVNNINYNNEGNFELCGVLGSPVRFESVDIQSLCIQREDGEVEDVISNGTYNHKYVQSDNPTTKIGDAFYIEGILYSIVQIEERICLYASESNKVIYTQHESTSLEELRKHIETSHEGIFFKKV